MEEGFEVVTINSKGKILTSSDEVLFDSEDFKTLSNKIDEVNDSLTPTLIRTITKSDISVQTNVTALNADVIKIGNIVQVHVDITTTAALETQTTNSGMIPIPNDSVHASVLPSGVLKNTSYSSQLTGFVQPYSTYDLTRLKFCVSGAGSYRGMLTYCIS